MTVIIVCFRALLQWSGCGWFTKQINIAKKSVVVVKGLKNDEITVSC